MKTGHWWRHENLDITGPSPETDKYCMSLTEQKRIQSTGYSHSAQ